MKILLVEDDDWISEAIVEDLTDQHYIVEVAEDGQAAWDLLDVFTYDLILLDINLPIMDGVTLCRRLRDNGCLTPILMLTGQDTLNDKVLGLNSGADDYLVKPFKMLELSARIRALRRRGNASLPPILEWGDLRLDPNTYEVWYQQKLLSLSPKEYRLLEFFLCHKRRVFSRSEILEHLWDFEQMPEEATIKVHISSLRQKLAAAGAPSDLIETVYGLGYRLKEVPEKA